jgi:hydroxymethylglutaryl-CoA reductase (NADPH)
MSTKIKLPPRGYADEDKQRRHDYLKEHKIDWLQHPIGGENYKGIIENHIGYVGMPVAVAGPALIHGDYAKGLFHIPVATIEGTLVLSMTRGLYAAGLSGGIETTHIKQEISRSPLFSFKCLSKLNLFVEWVQKNFIEIKKQSEASTSYGKLLRIDSLFVGSNVVLDFVYTTSEAAGQNMTTISTKNACDFIFAKTSELFGVTHYIIESNYNGDKVVSQRNLMLGRGHQVVAKAVIKRKVLRRILNLDEDFLELNSIFSSSVLGGSSVAAGNIGNNLHVANTLCAIYLATGQDAACIVENSGAILNSRTDADGNWEVSLTMRSLTVGTVGGGTRLPQQNQHLAMLGCQGENSSKKLAEILAAACLGTEISLASAIGSKEFASAHANYGR